MLDLVKDVRELKKNVGGLSAAVGYGLGDRLMPFMTDFVFKKYGVTADIIERQFIIYPDGRHDEINLYIEGRKDGQKIYLAGECKCKPGKKDIMQFAKVIKRLETYLSADVRGFIVAYLIAPEVEHFIASRHSELDYFKTYQIERIAAGDQNIKVSN